MGRTGFAGLRLNITQLSRLGGDTLFSAKTLTRGLIVKQFFPLPRENKLFSKLQMELFLCHYRKSSLR